MRMYNPPHPGEILKEDVLPELGLTVGQLAEHLGVSRPHLSRVLNGHAGISADMDLRFSEALGQPRASGSRCKLPMSCGKRSVCVASQCHRYARRHSRTC